MMLTTKGRYAARIMVRLAAHQQARPCRKHDIAEAEGISADYIEQILMKLKTAGLVVSFRGARGGFALGRRAEEITMADILDAAEGPINLVPCITEGCVRATSCVTRPVWTAATEALRDVFTSTTLDQMGNKVIEMEKAKVLDFSI